MFKIKKQEEKEEVLAYNIHIDIINRKLSKTKQKPTQTKQQNKASPSKKKKKLVGLTLYLLVISFLRFSFSLSSSWKELLSNARPVLHLCTLPGISYILHDFW